MDLQKIGCELLLIDGDALLDYMLEGAGGVAARAPTLLIAAAAERLLAALAERGFATRVLFYAAGAGSIGAEPIASFRSLHRAALRVHLLESTDVAVDDLALVRTTSPGSSTRSDRTQRCVTRCACALRRTTFSVQRAFSTIFGRRRRVPISRQERPQASCPFSPRAAVIAVLPFWGRRAHSQIPAPLPRALCMAPLTTVPPPPVRGCASAASTPFVACTACPSCD